MPEKSMAPVSKKESQDGASVEELEQVIRGYINLSRRYPAILSPQNFHRVCCALDVIGDAEIALAAYPTLSEKADVGERYIRVYGVLQLLFVEQDAVSSLSKIFGLKHREAPEIKQIRDIRNRSIGHPVSDRKGQPSTFISRSELGFRNFRMMVLWPNGRKEFVTIDIFDLIEKQRNALAVTLHSVADKLRDDEMAHREKYRDRPLLQVLHPSLPYLCGKVSEATHRSDTVNIGGAALQSIQKQIENFVAALRERGEIGAVQDFLDETFHAIDRLNGFFGGETKEKFSHLDAYIYSEFLTCRVNRLIEIAREIDDTYGAKEIDV